MNRGLDLGHGHTLWFFGWYPDRALNPQYAGMPNVERAGASISHPRADDISRTCSGAVTFDLPETSHLAADDHRWRVVSWDPLTIEPSVLCRICGDHGYIREGRWVPA